MDPLWLIALIIFMAGFFWGKYRAEKYIQGMYNKFTDEMHRQYLMLLKQHGVKLCEEAEESLKELNVSLEKSMQSRGGL